MKKEVMEFSAPQQKVTVCNGGKKALVLFNERIEERPISPILIGDTNTDGGEDNLSTIYIYDGYWIELSNNTTSGIIEAAKRTIIDEIEKYDSSKAVNEIVINGSSFWIDKSTRMGLRQNIADKKSIGQSNITVWMGGIPVTISCEKAEEWMCKIENYAYDCFNVTENHKSDILSMNSLEDILTYDVSVGYPEKVDISL